MKKHFALQFELIRKEIMTSQEKRKPAFEDDDKIQFGKHKGERLEDVPASYLWWLWNESLRTYSGREFNTHSPVSQQLWDKVKLANYIWNSKDAIEQEIGEVIE